MRSVESLKSGHELVIRYAMGSDAQDIIDYTKLVGGESDFLTFGEGEFEITYEQELEFIEKMLQADNCMMLLGLIEGQIISVASISGMVRPRVHHFAELGITVRKSHWGLGIGQLMMKSIESRVRQAGVIRRIHLKVRTDNTKAIALYESMGYKVEGLIKRQFRMLDENSNETFFDVLAMGINIDFS